MKTIKFNDFMNSDYEEDNEQLYIIRSDKVLYIGKAFLGIHYRWFGSGTSHILKRYNGTYFGNSAIGTEIINNLPTSMDWEIDMYTVDECSDFVHKHFPYYKMFDIDIAEISLIREYKPLLNVIHNSY